MEGRIVRQWEKYIEHHVRHNSIGIARKEWAVKFIIALWDHLHRIWTLRNGVYHADAQGTMTLYKTEAQALERKTDQIWATHEELQSRLQGFQETHFQQRETKDRLMYNSKSSWATPALLYVVETETRTALGSAPLETFLVRRSGIGQLQRSQLLEQGIVATFPLGKARSNLDLRERN
jgi:hypothetical protein